MRGQAEKGQVDRRARARGPRCYDLLSIGTPKDRIGRAVRQAQIDALIRLVPATVAIQILTAAVMVVGLRDTTDNFQLGLWFGAALLLRISSSSNAPSCGQTAMPIVAPTWSVAAPTVKLFDRSAEIRSATAPS